ncbi:hypothetical protein AZF37_00075 [endosymbiont 'TC1' of Trimyema compressum]|uniref:InlB B-repeat-containing protein n=1 Tax=endosymbiont 'TC1' of Trimyema compressum TaxID=243899 RepID=UPI0007F151DD|nr:InlB B-repeat-containing protein [endosymbiont 'TC1' of Trimyema compressum]AMP19781.1 hypothetical protein AZF37_00075 [endosymbiont 'TC1' of Trimyema compressum]
MLLTHSGHSFAGWHKEATLENKWDFDNDVVNTDITLHAKWLPTENQENSGTISSENNNEKNQGSSANNLIKSKSSINLAKTGNNNILVSSMTSLLFGLVIVIVGLNSFRKKEIITNRI